MKKLLLSKVLIACCAVSQLHGQETLSDIRNMGPEEIKVEGFRLNRDQKISLEGLGFRGRSRRHFVFTRAWILNARSRDVVWEMEDADTERQGRTLMRFTDELDLPRGDYEVYYSTFPYAHFREQEGFWGRFFRDIFDGDDYDDYYHEFREELRSFYITVRGRGERIRHDQLQQLREPFVKNAFVSMTELRDEEYQQQGFELERSTDIRIYAVGEARKDGTFDYGWIINPETRERVWKMTYRDSDHAGGDRKNRLVNKVLTLPAGRYVAFFVTDDSHSFDRWNASPPYDPMFWGMTLMVVNSGDSKRVKLFDYRDMPEENVIVDFTRLRDNEFRSKGFTVKKPLKIRVYAIGEGKREGMYDYGWIVDARTHKKIWEMDFFNTEHAGGGDKNRLFDGVIELDRGDYIVYCVTDDSHSYWDWNTAPPYDREGWGIKLIGVGKDFSKDDIEDYEPRKSGAILAQLIGMRDHARERERFSLKKDGNVRIYAIGEGMRGTMYDYAWIETEDGRVVWEMTYRRTRHAGGADKNRLFDDVVFLRKGNYIVYYESDDSHSFDDWNAAPPYDPINWGVTIYRVDD